VDISKAFFTNLATSHEMIGSAIDLVSIKMDVFLLAVTYASFFLSFLMLA